MLLSQNSQLRYPSQELAPNQVVAFNAIRYSVDICDISYSRLLENLSILTDQNSIGQLDFPFIFLDVWTIINNSIIFKKIIETQLGIPQNDPYLLEISKAVNLRNTNQHLDERISSVFSKEDLPIYGLLSWWKYNRQTNDAVIASIYSGIYTKNKSVKMEFSQIDEVRTESDIQHITFVGYDAKKNSNEKISIDKIIQDISTLINLFDNQIKEQLGKVSISERHSSDLVTKLTVKPT